MQTENIDVIVQLAEINPDIEVLWLYGSRAKGNAEQNSDYDLAVAFAENQKEESYKQDYCDQLRYQWSKITDSKVSIININKVPTPLAYSVINDGKVIFSSSELRLNTEQQRIWSLWEAYRYEHARNRK